ncbi:MAG TPA: peptidyl-prolyl cis-trans isomerase [Elusimicrobiota bacterium]|jgi:foldase protein PrsA|nr:peptidyl-prolyl cis-trans isomerase [Elusimicrobiota bacterium]
MKKSLLSIAILALALPALAQKKASDPIVSVNGAPITRGEALERTFRLHGVAVLNDMVDDLLLKQAAAAAGVKPDAAEAEARMARFQAQFPDPKVMEQQLAAQNASLKDVRARLDLQLVKEALLAKEKGLGVTDAEVRKFFDENKARLGSPEAVRLRMILVPTEKDAAEALAKVKGGTDFAALASQVSLDADSKAKGGDMGFVPRNVLQEGPASQLFGKKPGELIGPMKVEAGYAVFRVEENRAAKTPALKEVQKDLRRALLSDKVAKAWPAYVQALRGKAKIETFE